MGRWLLVLALFMAGCAHPPPVIAVHPIEKIQLGADIPANVDICIENPDVLYLSRPRIVCVSMDTLRLWFSHVRASD